MTAQLSSPSGPLKGELRAPGDKSISHRALILSALAAGRSSVTGMLEADDVMRTAAALAAAGVGVARTGAGAWRIDGVGIGGLGEPAAVLDMGNSGTAARLLLGVLASHDLTAFLTGDASLCARPMARVIEPLTRIGAMFVARSGMRLPLAIRGTAQPLPIRYRLPVASAQVKSAILLAGLNIAGRTTVVEPHPSRDHTERLLRLFGAELSVTTEPDGSRVVALTGQPELKPQRLEVPGDPSSAAFAAVAGLIIPGSELTIAGVGINPLRTGLFETLRAMGAAIEIEPRGELCGEPVADLRVRSSHLVGVEVPADRAPRMIDEYPILAVAAACAQGRTVMRGLGELRVKESDRLSAIARGLEACGVVVEAGADSLAVTGRGQPPPGGGRIETRLDHRIAMSFLVMGAAARQGVEIDDSTMIATSYPGFVEAFNRLGGAIQPLA